eukprot:SAG31_NODE_2618_length_5366_cov_2.137650_3_plen_140_part_00
MVNIETRVLPSAAATGASTWQIVCHILIDCQDAMGANLINTVAESLGPELLSIALPAEGDARSDGASDVRVGLRILSNHCPERVAKASFRLPAAALAYKGLDGAQVGRRIVEAAQVCSSVGSLLPYSVAYPFAPVGCLC